MKPGKFSWFEENRATRTLEDALLAAAAGAALAELDAATS